MNRKRYLYHVTEPENVENILREGLLRGGGTRKTFAVYLSENPLSWWQPSMKILRVDISDMMGEWSTFLPDSDEVLFWGDIPAERISLYKPKAKHFRGVTKKVMEVKEMGDICGDNRFEVIAEYKKRLIEGTNIEQNPDEMAVIDNILFRFWQMGWLDDHRSRIQELHDK